MSIRSEFESAAARAAAKRSIAVTLAALPGSDQRAVLADLLAERVDEAIPDEKQDGHPPGARRSVPPPGGAVSRTDEVVAALTERPGMLISELAERVYGDATRAGQNKARGVLGQLRKQGRARTVARGQWEIVAGGVPRAVKKGAKKPAVTRKIVLQVLREHPGITTNQIMLEARKITPGLNPQTVNGAIHDLVKRAHIARAGARQGEYRYTVRADLKQSA